MFVQPSPVFCVSIHTILFTVCLYQHHKLFAKSVLFSGNVLDNWLFISVFSMIIASSSPLICVLNGPSHLSNLYLVLLYRESPRSAIMHFYPDYSLFFPLLWICACIRTISSGSSLLSTRNITSLSPLSQPRILLDLSVYISSTACVL